MFSSMSGHKLLDNADFTLIGTNGSLPSVPTQRCAQHPKEVINMYCKDHDQVSCPPCIALNNRNCTNILFIPEEVENLYIITELNKTKQKLNKTKITMQEVEAAKENKIKELKEVFDKEVQSVKVFRQELQTLLDYLEQCTIKELKMEFDKIQSCLTSEINGVKALINIINEVSSTLKNSEGNKSQEFVSMKTAEKVTAKAENVEKVHARNIEKDISFTSDRNIKAFLQQLQALGKVGNFVPKSILYKVKQRGEIEVKLAGDREVSNIKGFCIEEDGSLLLADYYNKKLKRFDISTKTVKDYIDLQAEPNAVCLISKTEAVVSQENQTVQLVSLKNKLSATRKLTMNHLCYGLARTDGKLFISDKSQTVFIHDMNGQELKRISTDPFGKRLFLQASYIKVSADGDRVFVTDGKMAWLSLTFRAIY